MIRRVFACYVLLLLTALAVWAAPPAPAAPDSPQQPASIRPSQPRTGLEANGGSKPTPADSTFTHTAQTPIAQQRRWQAFARWALQVGVVLAEYAGVWLVITLLMSWVSRQKWGRADALLMAFVVGLLLIGRALVDWGFLVVRGIRPYAIDLVLIPLVMTVVFGALMLYYAALRVFNKRQMDKGGLRAWGGFWTVLALATGFGPNSPTGWVFYPLVPLYGGWWLWHNPWFLTARKVNKLKQRGQLREAIALMETQLQQPNLNAKTRFVVLNDLSNYYATLGEIEQTIHYARQAMEHSAAFRSAAIFPHANLASAYLVLGRFEESVTEVGQMWHLTETTSCVNGNDPWKGACHGLLARLALARGWDDEADLQAEKCLEKLPRETRTQPQIRERVANARSVQATVRLHAGQLDDAALYAQSAIKIATTDDSRTMTQTVLAEILMAKGDLAGAEVLCHQALQKAPDRSLPLLVLGNVLRAQGREVEARQAFEACRQAAPDTRAGQQARAILAGETAFDPVLSLDKSTPADGKVALPAPVLSQSEVPHSGEVLPPASPWSTSEVPA